MAENSSAGDDSITNPPSGTVVDKVVTNPVSNYYIALLYLLHSIYFDENINYLTLTMCFSTGTTGF